MLSTRPTASTLHLTGTVAAGNDASLVGALLGPWRAVRALGSSAHATTWEVEHVGELRRGVARVLRAAFARDTAAVTAFSEGAARGLTLAHEHLTTVVDHGWLSSGQPWLVKEHLDGRTLEAVLATEDFSAPRAAEVVRQLAAALEYGHAHGVVHGAIKPTNVLVLQLGARDFVKLVDGGLTWAAAVTAEHVDNPDQLAPEQISGGVADERTDVYALGALAWQLLVGRAPFWHRPMNAVLTAHLHDLPDSPAQHRSSVPPAIAAAVMKAMAKSPDERFQTVGAFAYALQCAIAHRQTPVPPLDAARVGESRHAVLAANGVKHLVLCEHASSAGCFVACDEPLAEGTPVVVQFDGLAPLTGVVVRHLDTHDGVRAGRQPGCFVEFKDAGPDARVQLDGVAGADELTAEHTLLRLRERLWGGPYAALGVACDATSEEISAAHAQLDDALETLAGGDLSVARAQELIAAQTRLASYAALLRALPRRAASDALHGNWRGVSRCLEEGLSASKLEALRFAFLKSNPLADLAARRHAELASTLAARGQRDEARVAAEAALSIDPLRLQLHDLHASLVAQPLRRAVDSRANR